jgi:hypothetical protein
MNETQKKRAYFRTVFGTANPEKNRQKAALKHAHETREFEIRLYWQRSLFFWGFILTLFAGLGLMITAKKQTDLIRLMILGISLLGLFVNYAWLVLERGAKSWQENWELHIDYLENDFTGRLHKTVLGEGDKFFSVSRITRSIIIAFLLFWFAATLVGVVILVPSIQENILRLITDKGRACLIVILLILIFIITMYLRLWGWKTTSRTMPPRKQSNKKKNTKHIEGWQRAFPIVDSDEAEIERLFHQFKKKYSKKTLNDAIKRYLWKKDTTPKSNKERQDVAKKYQHWISSGISIGSAEDSANLVTMWGFKRKAPQSIIDNLQHFCDLISAWDDAVDVDKMRDLLVENLKLHEVGIARSSHWLCFINQNRYCIYSSRISYALRGLGEGDGKTFPTVRGQGDIENCPKPTSRTEKQMAADYIKFLKLMQRVVEEYKLDSVAEVEKGLFMLGKDSSNWD